MIDEEEGGFKGEGSSKRSREIRLFDLRNLFVGRSICGIQGDASDKVGWRRALDFCRNDFDVGGGIARFSKYRQMRIKRIDQERYF